MSLTSIDLYETDGLLLFRPKSIIRKTIDLERVIENAENIYYFYLDSNWEFQFIELKNIHPSTPGIPQGYRGFCWAYPRRSHGLQVLGS